MKNSLKIGVNRIIINPPLGSYLTGYANRKGGATEIHDNLTATSLILSSDMKNFFVLVAVDNLSLNWEIVDRIKFKIEEHLNIPKDNIRVFSSHTHSGPVGWAPVKISIIDRVLDFFSRTRLLPVEPINTKGIVSNSDYFSELVERVGSSVEFAFNKMKKVKVYYSKTSADFSFNRRSKFNKMAPLDNSIQFIKFVSEDKIIASIINYACHNVLLGPSSNVVSADLAGEVRANLEAEFGGSCLFIQGAAGDINPKSKWSDNSLSDMKLLGKIISDSVIANKEEMVELKEIPILSFTDEVKAYLKTTNKFYKFKLAKVVRNGLNKKLKIPKILIFPMLDFRFPWKIVFDKDRNGYYTSIRIGVLRIGDVIISSVSMEAFNNIGVKVKELSKLPVCIFAGYTDGLTGYLPEEKDFKYGGYEIETVPYFYRLPGSLDSDTAEKVITKLQELMDKTLLGNFKSDKNNEF